MARRAAEQRVETDLYSEDGHILNNQINSFLDFIGDWENERARALSS